jgi:tripartite-type tricarboxylate transporter receptor subunit TctC
MNALSLRLSSGFVAAIAIAALPLHAQAAEPRPFYAGKTLNVIAGVPPGGAADAYARLLARHLARHIPGEPAIVVANVPGAGGLRSVMYLNNAAADGTVVATFSSALINESLIAPQRVPVDFRSYAWIGNISEDVRVCYVWGASGIKNWQDLSGYAKPLFMGASAAGAAGTDDLAILRNLFGVRMREVQGYSGSADKRLAVERREIDGECGGWSALPEDWLRDNKINVLVRLSPTLVPGMNASVPFGGDLLKDARDRPLYDFLVAPERLGRLFMVSGKVPVDRSAVLREAFDATVADPQFLSDAQRMKLLVTPMKGGEVAGRIRDLYATPAAIITRAKSIVSQIASGN